MYTITIEKTEAVKRTVGNQWAVVAQEEGQPKYGYTPEIEKTVTETIKVYEQSVKTLDLADVIAVVNGINKPASS